MGDVYFGKLIYFFIFFITFLTLFFMSDFKEEKISKQWKLIMIKNEDDASVLDKYFDNSNGKDNNKISIIEENDDDGDDDIEEENLTKCFGKKVEKDEEEFLNRLIEIISDGDAHFEPNYYY